MIVSYFNVKFDIFLIAIMILTTFLVFVY